MEKQFKISEMTKMIGVEAHVLRYWEEELQLPIKRNDLGHRYYTQDDVERFLQIKQLKEKGIQLKGIRSMLDLPQESTSAKLLSNYSGSRLLAVDYNDNKFSSVDYVAPNRLTSAEHVPSNRVVTADFGGGGISTQEDKGEKAYRLQLLLKELVKEAVQESNELMANDIKESIIKELDYQFRVAAEEQERQNREYRKQQEEYFEKLDHMIQDSRLVRKKRTMSLFKLSPRQKSETV